MGEENGVKREPVPAFSVIASWSVAEREAKCAEWVSAIDMLEARVAAKGSASDSQATALHHLRRGVATVATLRARESGEPNPNMRFGPPRPVHSFLGAIESQKAVNRLLSLCEFEHRVVGELLVDPAFPIPARLREAWELVERALAAGVTDAPLITTTFEFTPEAAAS